MTDRIIEAEPDLTAVRPLLESTATGVMGTATLAPAFRVSATPLHSALVGGGEDPVVLRLADTAAIVVGVGSAVAPEWPWSVPPDPDVRLPDLGAGVEVNTPSGWCTSSAGWRDCARCWDSCCSALLVRWRRAGRAGDEFVGPS